jgi:hypothetical protein
LPILTDNAFPTVVFSSITKPHDETSNSADKTKLLLNLSDEIVELVDKASVEVFGNNLVGGDADTLLCSPPDIGSAENVCIERRWKDGIMWCFCCVQRNLLLG